MSTMQNFRSAFNGFNREDVAHYLEYLNNKYQTQINQLTSENEQLRAQLEQPRMEDSGEHLTEMLRQYEELEAKLAESEAARAALEAKLAQPAAPEQAATVSDELAAYRRAERIEREARERAELVYFQANGVLTEASAKVVSIAFDITDMADHVMAQLTQLQRAVSASKQALQDASSIMNTIRPNK